MTVETIEVRGCSKCGGVFNVLPHRMRAIDRMFLEWKAGDCPTCGYKWTGVVASFDSEEEMWRYDDNGQSKEMREREAEERSGIGGQPDPSAVDHPPHYSEGRGIEPIEVITDWELGFCLGNVVKYIGRAGRKGDALEDLRKALWYLQKEIQEREGGA